MDVSFLTKALELLGRPGNAVRSGLVHGPQGALDGLTGKIATDATELPFINQLPDQGFSAGPLNLTPRTVAGFGANLALDPVSYLPFGKMAEMGGKALGLGEKAVAAGGDDLARAGGSAFDRFLSQHGSELAYDPQGYMPSGVQYPKFGRDALDAGRESPAYTGGRMRAQRSLDDMRAQGKIPPEAVTPEVGPIEQALHQYTTALGQFKAGEFPDDLLIHAGNEAANAMRAAGHSDQAIYDTLSQHPDVAEMGKRLGPPNAGPGGLTEDATDQAWYGNRSAARDLPTEDPQMQALRSSSSDYKRQPNLGQAQMKVSREKYGTMGDRVSQDVLDDPSSLDMDMGIGKNTRVGGDPGIDDLRRQKNYLSAYAEGDPLAGNSDQMAGMDPDMLWNRIKQLEQQIEEMTASVADKGKLLEGAQAKRAVGPSDIRSAQISTASERSQPYRLRTQDEGGNWQQGQQRPPMQEQYSRANLQGKNEQDTTSRIAAFRGKGQYADANLATDTNRATREKRLEIRDRSTQRSYDNEAAQYADESGATQHRYTAGGPSKSERGDAALPGDPLPSRMVSSGRVGGKTFNETYYPGRQELDPEMYANGQLPGQAVEDAMTPDRREIADLARQDMQDRRAIMGQGLQAEFDPMSPVLGFQNTDTRILDGINRHREAAYESPLQMTNGDFGSIATRRDGNLNTDSYVPTLDDNIRDHADPDTISRLVNSYGYDGSAGTGRGIAGERGGVGRKGGGPPLAGYEHAVTDFSGVPPSTNLPFTARVMRDLGQSPNASMPPGADKYQAVADQLGISVQELQRLMRNGEFAF